MKNLKKLMVLSAAALMGLAACGGQPASSSQAPSSQAPSSEAPSSQAPSSEAPSSEAPSSQAPSSEASSEAPSSAEGPIRPGYTSLANQNANGPIDDQGYYTAGGIKFKTKDTLKTTYATEPTKDLFNYLTNTWTYNSYHYCNMVDGLVENDKYGNIVGALAIAYKTTINGDGTQTWSFQLREDANWVKNDDGSVYAQVKAQDFVSSAEYVLNALNGAGAANLYTDFIVGAKAYLDGETEDFDTVGVKAPEDFIIEYTLKEPTPYFITCLTYSPFLPVNGEFLENEGTDFGTTVNDILVNGAFRITEHTPENKIVYTKNSSYYDAEHVYLNKVERKFVPGDATPDTTRTWYEAGEIDSFAVSAKDKTGYAKYVTGGEQGEGSLKNPVDPSCNGVQSYYTATFIGYWNFNRDFYEFADDAHTTTEQERKDTNIAIYNKDFRLGFFYGLDAEAFMKQLDPVEPYNYIMRGYTNKELVSAGGKDFTDFVNDVYNEKQGLSGEDAVSLIGIDNGGDPVHDNDKAHEYFVKAKAALDAANVTYPIYIDMLGDMEVEAHAFEKDMVKALEEAATVDGVKMVKCNFNVPSSNDQNTDWGSIHSNYDFSLWSGWGPDYADPKTFAHTWIIYGDMVEYSRLPSSESDLATMELSPYVPQKYQDLKVGDDASAALAAMQEDLLGEYTELYRIADAIVDGDKLVERYEAFAEAEYNLIYESAIIAPWYTRNGYSAQVAKTVPWQAGRASYGLTSDKYKNVIAIENPITQEQRARVTDEYNAGK